MTLVSVKESAKFVANLAKYVQIDQDKVENVAKELYFKIQEKPFDVKVWKSGPWHPKTATSAAVDWIFVVDSLNFSFWPESGQKYLIQGQTGYYALCAAVNRALEKKIPITNPNYFAKITESELRDVFKSDNQFEIPLISERLEVLRESGKVLLEKFDGSFFNCVKTASNSAQKLLQLIVENFPSFADEATYGGRKVTFYKRAQILVADVWGCFEGQGFGRFDDIDSLSMFADYRVPQVLAYFDVFKYSEELMSKLKSNQLLTNGSDFEVEIRSCSIWATELIVEAIKRLSQLENKNIAINSVLLDFYLWGYRREHAEEVEKCIPFHRTRSIYY